MLTSGVASQSGSALSGAAAMTGEVAVLAGQSGGALSSTTVMTGRPQGQEEVLTGQSVHARSGMDAMTGRPNRDGERDEREQIKRNTRRCKKPWPL